MDAVLRIHLLGGHPKPANDKPQSGRLIPTGGLTLRRCEQRLEENKKHQIIALGRLGWSLRRIQKGIGVRRETASDYLKEAGLAVRPSDGWSRGAPANRSAR
jgi:hypothetical protein